MYKKDSRGDRRKVNVYAVLFYAGVVLYTASSCLLAQRWIAQSAAWYEQEQQLTWHIEVLQAVVEHRTEQRDSALEIISELEALVETEHTFEHLVDIPLSAALQEYTYDMCVKYEIEDSYLLVLAVMAVESNYTGGLISASNDYGLMQINICNHEWLSSTLGLSNLLEDEQSIEAGVYMLSTLLSKYDDYGLVLMSYNLGESGARAKINAGIYSTDYSTSVLEVLSNLEQK